MIIAWADRLAVLSPAQFTLLGVLLMIAAGLTAIYVNVTERSAEDGTDAFGDD